LQRAYPWSPQPESTIVDCSNGNYGGPNPTTTSCVANGGMNNVGMAPNGDGLCGQSDMGGNAAEWVLDYYASPYMAPCVDCANLVPATAHTIRGGSIRDDVPILRSASRGPFTPGTFISSIGFRCARPP